LSVSILSEAKGLQFARGPINLSRSEVLPTL
jgi:hypothetical protein